MGLECSQEKPFDLSALWGTLPPNAEIVITREKITITEKPSVPKLDISTRVTYENFKKAEEHDVWANLPKDFPDDTGRVRGCFSSTDWMTRFNSNSSPEAKIKPRVKLNISRATSIEMDSEMSPEVEIIYQRPPVFKQTSSSSDWIDETPERTPSTLFDTYQDIVTDSDAGGSVEPLRQQQDDAVERKLVGKTNVEVNLKEVHRMSPVKTANGTVLPRKIATVYEQKGKIECHVYFTPRTSKEIWPRLVVTVNEDWNFLKVMRKSIAEIQRAIKKGDRDGTHDWVFEYHPNQQVRKIKKELRVLFGATAIEFRDSNLNKKIKTMTKDFVNKMWVLQKKSIGEQARGRSITSENEHFRAKSMPLFRKKQEDVSKLEVSADQNYEECDSELSPTSLNSEIINERKPTTLFQTFLGTGTASEAEVEAYLQQQGGTAEQKLDGETNLNITPRKVHCITPPKTTAGIVLPKKIATVYEQKGKLECHVYFTPRTSAEVWPHLVVTVCEDWNFLKVMRKSIAELQRAIKKGDRDGTHDWVFEYHPNNQVKKIKKELRVLLGGTAIEFRGSNLKKKINTMTTDFVNKIWVLPKKSIEENDRGRHSRIVSCQVGVHRATSQPPKKKKQHRVSKVTRKRRSRKKMNKTKKESRNPK